MAESAGPFGAEELLEHLPALRGLARALVRGDEVEDLVSETVLRAYERPPRHRGNVRAWLQQTLRNLAVDRARRGGSRAAKQPKLRATAEQADLPPTPDTVLARSEAMRRLHDALDQVGEPDRHLLLLRYFENLDSTEIGERLGVAPATIRARLARALGRLRAQLRQRYGKEAFAPCFLLLEPLPAAVTPAGSGGAAPSAAASSGAGAGPASTGLPALAWALIPTAAIAAIVVWLAGPDEADPVDPAMRGALAEAGETADPPAAPDGLAADAERARGAGAPVDAPTEIRLVGFDGEPVRNANVEIYFEGAMHETWGRRDARFPWPEDFTQGGLVYVRPPNRVPWWTWHEPAEDGARIVVPPGDEVVLEVDWEPVDGVEPPAFTASFLDHIPGVDSDLYAYREHWRTDDDALRMEPPRGSSWNLVAQPDDDGRVRFWGLQPGWQGRVALKSRFWDWPAADREVDGRPAIDVRAGRPAAVHLKARPVWRLRCVFPEDPWTARGVFPPSWFLLEGAAEADAGAGSADLPQSGARPAEHRLSYRGQFDADARVQDLILPRTPDLPAPHDGAWQSELRVNWGGRELRFPLTLPVEGGDLGTIRLPAPVPTTLEVVDSRGHPIADARVQMPGARITPTDAEGRTELPLLVPDGASTGPVQAQVTAPGHFAGTLQREAAPGETLRMTLEPEFGLRVDFRLVHDGEPAGLARTEFVLRCLAAGDERPGGLFGRPLSAEERLHLFTGASAPEFVDGRDGDVWELRSGTRMPAFDNASYPPFEVLGLKPTHPVELTAEVHGRVVHREVIEVWPAGTMVERTLTLETPDTIRLEGRVLDDTGARVPNAMISLELESGEDFRVRADGFGDFVIARLPGRRFTARVWGLKEAWAESPPREIVIDDPEQPLELRVERARWLTVRVVHADGRPVTSGDLDLFGRESRIEFDRSPSAGHDAPAPDEDGVFVRKIPRGAPQLEAQLWLDGVRHRWHFATREAEHTLVVPDCTRTELDIPLANLPDRALLLTVHELGTSVGAGAMWRLDREAGAARDSGEDAVALALDLPPGRYRALLQRHDGAAWQEWGKARTFVVPAGGPVRLVFDPAGE